MQFQPRDERRALSAVPPCASRSEPRIVDRGHRGTRAASSTGRGPHGSRGWPFSNAPSCPYGIGWPRRVRVSSNRLCASGRGSMNCHALAATRASRAVTERCGPAEQREMRRVLPESASALGLCAGRWRRSTGAAAGCATVRFQVRSMPQGAIPAALETELSSEWGCVSGDTAICGCKCL